MSKRKEISYQIRHLIISDCRNKLSYRMIARKYNISKSAVEKMYKKYLLHNTVENVRGRGRKRCTTVKEDRRIVRKCRQDPTIASRNIAETLGLNVSTKTIKRRLHEAGLKCCKARRKPHINKINMKKRLAFAKKYVNMPISFWKNIIWTNESKFELRQLKKKHQIWRKRNKTFKKSFITPTVKFGGGSLMVWGCFSRNGIGTLALIDGIMNAEKYIEILNENLEVTILKMGLDEGFVFQQDNDPKHTAKKSKKFFKDSNIKLVEWPAQSPDLNPIENLWNILDAKVPLNKRRNKIDFFTNLQSAFENINKDYIENLITSIPRRLEAVIQAKGSNTKY